MEIVVIFIGAVLLDVFYTLYVIRASQHKAFQTSFFAMCIALSTSVVTIGYIKHGVPGVIAFAIGSFVGTYITVWSDKKLKG